LDSSQLLRTWQVHESKSKGGIKPKATAEAKATALKTAAQSTADWERIMAEASKNSWKDEVANTSVQHPPDLELYSKRGSTYTIRF